MKPRDRAPRRTPWLALVAFALFGAAAHAEAPGAADPAGVVKGAVEGVLTAVRADPKAAGGDLEAISRVVEQKFLPATDFETTTRLAVGEAAWSKATAAQQQELFRQFQTLLVRTYATELTQIMGTQVKFDYRAARPSGTSVIVPTQMNSNGDDNEIDYRLAKGEHGYRIYDINIMGAWLVTLYRGQFANVLQQGGIDGLIKSLAEHNAR